MYVIGAPISASYSPLGRGSKVYAAFDVANKRLVCLKIYWNANGTHPELDIYRTLRDANVHHIATPIAGGFLDDETITQDHISAGTTPNMRKLYCFVTEEPGRSLSTFETEKVLFDCISDALKGMFSSFSCWYPLSRILVETFVSGHQEAVVAGVLHRDVSANNILIDIKTGRGLLNDWDMAKYLRELKDGPTQHSRSVSHYAV